MRVIVQFITGPHIYVHPMNIRVTPSPSKCWMSDTAVWYECHDWYEDMTRTHVSSVSARPALQHTCKVNCVSKLRGRYTMMN